MWDSDSEYLQGIFAFLHPLWISENCQQENKKEDGEDVQEQDQKQEGAEKENERVIVRYTV